MTDTKKTHIIVKSIHNSSLHTESKIKGEINKPYIVLDHSVER